MKKLVSGVYVSCSGLNCDSSLPSASSGQAAREVRVSYIAESTLFGRLYGNVVRDSEGEVFKMYLDYAQANEDIIEMYQDIIKLRQKVLADNVKLSEYGRGSGVEFVAAKVKVSEARIQLARLEGQQDVVIVELRNIVKLYTELKEALEKEVKIGQRSNVYVDEMEIRLLEAKIRLARAIQEKE